MSNANPATLSFEHQQLKLNTLEDGEKIAEKIYASDELHTFVLRGNTLGVDAAYPIAKAIENRPELRVAQWSDLFTGRLKEEIPETLLILFKALECCYARLEELDLSDNAIGPVAVPGIKNWLASEHACELKALRLNNCGMGIAGVTIAECLVQCLEKSAQLPTPSPLQLQIFIAGRNRLEYKSTLALAGAFSQIGTLEEIAMPQNGIKWEGIAELARAVKANPKLRILNLNDNTFGKRGAIAMAGALANLKCLEVVDFGDCLCRDQGAIEIVRQLKKSGSPLRVLNLEGNEITPEAGITIIKLSTQIPTLEKLLLGTNCFGHRLAELEELVASDASYSCVDLGDDDDQGTASEESENEEEEEASQGASDDGSEHFGVKNLRI